MARRRPVLQFVANEAAALVRTQEGSVLIIPDLHIGFERALATRGITLPSQTARLQHRLDALIDTHRPAKLLFLGDIKHGTARILPHEWSEVPALFQHLLERVSRVEVIPGNHDGGLRKLLPPHVVLHPVGGMVLRAKSRRIGCFHGHAWPAPELVRCPVLVTGHHHFTVELHDASGLRMVEPVWVVAGWRPAVVARALSTAQPIARRKESARRRLDLLRSSRRSPHVYIMPTFNPLLRGVPVNSTRSQDYLGPLFRARAIAIEDAELYLMDGTFVGTVENLRSPRAEPG